MASKGICEAVKDEAKAVKMAEVLKALAHPIRLRIMALLASRGEASVTEITKELGLPQAIVSQQLGRLRLSAQVRVSSRGGFRYYSLATKEASDLLECLLRCCEARGSNIE